MKVLREIREVKSDSIEIKLPEEFREKTLEIIVFPLEETKKKPGKKGRWARAAEEMSEQGYLRGRGKELLESIREFRDDFEIRAPLEKRTKRGQAGISLTHQNRGV